MLQVGREPILLNRFLDTVGDGTGINNAIGNYTLTQFKIQPAIGHEYKISSLIIFLRDNASLSATGYGGGTALTAGISVTVRNNNGSVMDITNAVPVKTNFDWMRFGIVSATNFVGTNYLQCIISFANQDNGRIRLLGSQGDYLCVTVRDNLSHLVEHRFLAQGTIIDNQSSSSI